MNVRSVCIVVGMLGVSVGANACEWHAGGFGGSPYGSQWREYNPAELDKLIESTYKKQAEGSDSAQAKKRKARPTFGSSAARAVESAQARVTAAKAEEAAAADSSDQPE